MKIGDVFKNKWETYEIITGFEQNGKRKKLITQKLGSHILKHTLINLENMSASVALERIMDICAILPNDKSKIIKQITLSARPTTENKKCLKD